jgi:hypothetical protein
MPPIIRIGANRVGMREFLVQQWIETRIPAAEIGRREEQASRETSYE